jgi:hypothetical protein
VKFVGLIACLVKTFVKKIYTVRQDLVYEFELFCELEILNEKQKWGKNVKKKL